MDFLVDRRDFWSQQKPDYPKGPKEEIGEVASWHTVAVRAVNKRPTVAFIDEMEVSSKIFTQ